MEILSGVFEGRTTGAPVTLFIRNQDADSKPYEILRQVFRPGHGDFTYYKKYGHFDFRGGGRYSARETAGRVAAGAVASQFLAAHNIEITGYTVALGGVRVQQRDLSVIDTNRLFCPDNEAAQRMEERIEESTVLLISQF